MVYVEECVKLNANDFRTSRGRAVVRGGGLSVGVIICPDKLCLVWPPRNGQTVERVKVPLTGPTNGWIRWFRCPTCGKRTPALFLPPGGDRFACRDCTGATRYSAWYWPGKRRQPKTPAAWVRWFERRAEKVLRKGGEQ